MDHANTNSEAAGIAVDERAAGPHPGNVLAAGAEAPEFRALDQNGQMVALAELLERGPVILYFYPRDFTPVCTREACLFRDIYEDLRGRGATIVGVSVDDADSHARFAERHNLPFSLLADPDKTMARSYEAIARFRPGTKRVTYVIGTDRRIRGVFHHELRARKHVDDVLECLETL